MVDDGRAKQMRYKVVGKETVKVGGQSRTATKVSRVDDDKQQLLWIVPGLPVPARILQRKDGKDEMDLDLTSIEKKMMIGGAVIAATRVESIVAAMEIGGESGEERRGPEVWN